MMSSFFYCRKLYMLLLETSELYTLSIMLYSITQREREREREREILKIYVNKKITCTLHRQCNFN